MQTVKQKHEWICQDCGNKIDINKEPIFVLIYHQSYYICYYCAMKRYVKDWKKDKRFFDVWIELNKKKKIQTTLNLLLLEAYKKRKSKP
jgi:DNA-directed RNA polymerase subunit RPC12/RpoP